MSAIAFDPARTALVLIDLQHAIVGRELHPFSGPEVVARCSQMAAVCREVGATVVYVHVLLTDILRLPADIPRPAPGDLPANASDIVPEAGMQPGDLMITKRQWGAFYDTGLDQQLRRRGIKTMIMGGIATNFGVESTARAAFDRGYELVFASDAMAGQSDEMHNFSVQKLFPIMGRVRTTEEIIDSLRTSQ